MENRTKPYISSTKIIYQISEEISNNNRKKYKFKNKFILKFYILSNFQKEINYIETSRNIKINFDEDNSLNNSEIIFVNTDNKKNDKIKNTKRKTIQKNIKKTTKKTDKKVKEKTKTKAKSKNQKTTLKEIKNKKTGWWQK